MPRVIVPVGLSMGPRYRYVRPPDPTPECYEVHLGDDLIELNETEAVVWAAAFVDSEQHAKLAVDRRSLVQLVSTAPTPVADAEAVVDDLTARGLLVEFDTEADLEPVFRGHKLLPLGEGLGSTAEDPHLHRIGHEGRAKVAVSNAVFVQWSYSMLHPNLWEACAYYADDADHVEAGGKELDLTPQKVAQDVAIALPVMIAAQCAFLDPVTVT